ncbi:MAG: hypothetical protein J6D37_00585 [Clostridia bacterium]|nr:hypothetical protein [Clostridia bacterium]
MRGFDFRAKSFDGAKDRFSEALLSGQTKPSKKEKTFELSFGGIVRNPKGNANDCKNNETIIGGLLKGYGRKYTKATL